MNKVKITDLLIFVLSAELVGALSGLISGGSFGTYYASLAKPPLAPPGWLFPVMWGVLYAVMGISAYMIYASEDIAKKKALDLYWVQLAANALWSPVFFGMKSFVGAVVVVAVMLVLIVWMLAVFRKINFCAAIINLPYLLWTLFAAYLSAGFLILN
ncbi:MAG: tryptophan-rich sensory protein [Ruminiclostridium sp.]|nr:tryptophan-rich sensory protein [Ruminiclostridium sp.]